jgi:predicted negative regulator of RcsB-dependent stress response
MATQLDLQEQEQLDALKAFWNQYGNLITWLLVLALGAYAAWAGWHWYQRDQGLKAGAVYDALEKAAQAGDAERTAQIFGDLKDKYGRTVFATQGALLAAGVAYDKDLADAARAALAWAADKGSDAALQTIARLRLAGLLIEARQPDQALAQIDAATAPGFEALAADRRGDALMAAGKASDAERAWQLAYAKMSPELDYRRLVQAKLEALGATPSEPAASEAAR